MTDRQLNALLADHYDRINHPPQPEPDFNLIPALNKLKSQISPCLKPIARRKKPEPQP